MAHHGVNAIRDEDRPPFEDDLLPALVDEQDARDDEGETNQLADAPYIPDEQGRGRVCRDGQEGYGERKPVHLDKQGDHEANVRQVAFTTSLDQEQREVQE